MTLEDRTKVILANVGKHYEDCTVRPCKCPGFILTQFREALSEENRLGRLAVEAAQRQAYEDAAKIAEQAEEHWQNPATCIRARAQMVGK